MKNYTPRGLRKLATTVVGLVALTLPGCSKANDNTPYMPIKGQKYHAPTRQVYETPERKGIRGQIVEKAGSSKKKMDYQEARNLMTSYFNNEITTEEFERRIHTRGIEEKVFWEILDEFLSESPEVIEGISE
jgi:hypothetical protein